MRTAGVLLPLLVAAFLYGEEPKAATPAREPLAPRNDLPGLKNYAKVSDALHRGAQPDAEGFAELKKMGIKTVVNLRGFHSDRDALRGTGLRYVHIHCQAWHPEEEDVVKFLSVLKDPANQPVFVHCEYGADRTGMMVAAYRIVEQGWSPEEAVKELRPFGFHEVFATIMKYLQRLDKASVQKQVKEAPSVETDVVK
jgi:protein tyrosine/serine phosphatase